VWASVQDPDLMKERNTGGTRRNRPPGAIGRTVGADA
jgi:hypothetical protein